jgi:protein TonB
MLVRHRFGHVNVEPLSSPVTQAAPEPGDRSFDREPMVRPARPAHRNFQVVASGVDVTETVAFGADRGRLAALPAASGGAWKSPLRWLPAAAIAFSIGVHAATIVGLLPPADADPEFGTIADKSDAISLATTQTLVLESIETETTQPAAAASAASQAGSVQSAEAVPQPLTEVKEAEVTDNSPPQPVKVADVTPTAVTPSKDPLPVIRGNAAPDDVSEVKAVENVEKPEDVKPSEVETKDVEHEQAKPKEKEQKEREKTAQAASRAQTAGSTTSRSSAAHAAINGRVSASRGNILSYGARVRAQLARYKPAGDGRHGTVLVSFGITTNGDLSYVRLSGSSGSSELDQVALATVRRAAPFGSPPTGASLEQLRFSIPFYFR